MYLKGEIERMQRQGDHAIRIPGMGEPCRNCGWARRYHYGIKGTGYCIPVPDCRGFIPSDPNSKAWDLFRPKSRILRPVRIVVIPPIEVELPRAA